MRHINPLGIVPIGPDIDFMEPHGRDKLGQEWVKAVWEHIMHVFVFIDITKKYAQISNIMVVLYRMYYVVGINLSSGLGA